MVLSMVVCGSASASLKLDLQAECVGYTVIGDNAEFGANSCIIGDITIGNNVTIGAMSLINKNVPDNHTVYNSKDMIVIRNAA
jgi:serine O-acetyltransferase